MSIRDKLMVQFGNPKGVLGKLAGLIMSVRSSNKERNIWAISKLELKSNYNVLEIGYGPGLAIKCASEKIDEGKITGLDHSIEMYKMASKKNKIAIKSKKVNLQVGTYKNLSETIELFDVIYSVNIIQFLDEPVQVFSDLRKKLNPGGKLAVFFQPRNPGATEQDADDKAKEIAIQLKEAGYKDISTDKKIMSPVSTICVIGVN